MEILEEILETEDTDLIVHITAPIYEAHIECSTMDLNIKDKNLIINPEDFEFEIDLTKCKIEAGWLVDDIKTIELSGGDTKLNIDIIH